MWIQGKYGSLKKFTRGGKLISLTLPKDTKISQNLYSLNVKAKSLDFIKGKDTYILSDEIGIADDVEFSFFFLDEILCIQLNKGFLYLKETNGTISSINQKHKIQSSTLKEGKIIWKSLNDLKVFANYVIKDKYNLISEADIKNYRNNLMFTVKSSFESNQGNLFTLKFLKISEEIGGSFNFEIKEKIEKKISAPIDVKENNLYEDKTYKKSKKYNEYDEFEDSEDSDEVSSSMHEIDIFNDYVPLDD